MARIEKQVRQLVAEDDEMRSAIETVLERAESGTVRWIDVREDLTTGQWGRLIETGVLVDGEDGFVLADVEATRAGLGDADAGAGGGAGSVTDPDEIEDTEWTQWDKAAAVLTAGLFAGYAWQPVRELIGGALDVVLGPVEAVLPFYAVIMVLALLTGLYSTLLQANLMNTEKMGAYQQRMKDIQERRKAAKERGDDEALERIQEEQMEAMGDQLGMFKEQFRPMVWIMFLTIPVFLWMYWRVGFRTGGNPNLEQIVLPLVGVVSWTDSIVGPIQAWIVWYFLCSMCFTQVLRKGLNINISPTG